MKYALLFALFALSLVLTGCQRQVTGSLSIETSTPPPGVTPATTPSLATATNELKTVASGLQYQDLVAGTGQKPAFNQTARIAYVGKLTNGTVFDKGVDDFKLGVREVIKGWDLGIAGGGGIEPMREGGKRKLIIPPHLGYGETSRGTIPPNSTLVFEVELLRVNKPGLGMR